jgi:hypothetical protein
MPFDWRRPTKARYKRALWNPDDRRVFVPKVYGWGYTLNFARLFSRSR